MAEPAESYPDSATHGARHEQSNGDGSAALQRALDEHGEDLAAAVGASDELSEALTTAILVIASTDEDELEHITGSAANLVDAADGLTTDGAADLATTVGEDADELSAALETVLDLQREGHLDDLATVATAFAGSLSAEEVEELATMLEESGSDLVDALEVVLDLQREGHLEELVDIAKALSVIDVDPDAAQGVDDVLGAVGEAHRESEPVGLLGMVRELRSTDARAGLGYLVSLLKAQGRRTRRR